MATQANINTVEAEVHKALHAAGAISDANYGDRKKVKWSSASRTDKGVHAAACLVTTKLLVSLNDAGSIPEATVDSWNARLPSDIKIVSVLRAPKNGRAHSMCSLREYEYLVPEAALHGKPVADLTRILKRFEGTHRFLNFAGRLSQRKSKSANSDDDDDAFEEEDSDADGVSGEAGKRKAVDAGVDAISGIQGGRGKKGRGDGQEQRAGDWKCPKCQAHVFAKVWHGTLIHVSVFDAYIVFMHTCMCSTYICIGGRGSVDPSRCAQSRGNVEGHLRLMTRDGPRTHTCFTGVAFCVGQHQSA